jgi:hypothetical protein
MAPKNGTKHYENPRILSYHLQQHMHPRLQSNKIPLRENLPKCFTLSTNWNWGTRRIMSYFINDIKSIVIESSPLHFGSADKIVLKSDWPLLDISKNI